MLTALEQLRSAAPLHGLSQVLLGQRPPSPPENVSDLQFFDESLNESQKDAVRFALGAHEIALVHGPPGVTYPIHIVIMAHVGLNVIVDRQDIHIGRDYTTTCSCSRQKSPRMWSIQYLCRQVKQRNIIGQQPTNDPP